MPDPQVFALPDVGEGLTEAEIVAWHVALGDAVAMNDTLVEVETAKSVVELPSPYAGVVLELHAAEGETLPVGHALITIGEATEAPVAAPAAEPPPPPPPPVVVEPEVTEPVEAPLVLVGTGPREAGGRRIRLSRPDGPEFARSQPAVAVATDAAAAPAQTRIPVRGVRKHTAQAMVRSASTAPHAGMWTTVDVSATMALLRRLKADRAWSGVRVNPLLLAARTVALAVRQFPEINASWDDDAQEIVLHRDLNLGIAAATPRGLMVPTIKNAGSQSLQELARTLDDLVGQARAGTLTPADMSGGTLTVTNVGTFGIEGATPIINPPEAAILALGAIQPRPWVVNGMLEVRDVMTLSISIDHRLVDGELGAKVLGHVASTLNDPSLALL